MEKETKLYSKNSDILFIYDAKLCNPNGDPDDENKPRMDYETDRNLVSDVRLKRYIRDYLESTGHEIFVSKVDGETVNATVRLQKFFEKEGRKVNLNKLTSSDVAFLLSKLFDVRLFGATMPIKAEEGEEKGASSNFIGPVQFNWGYSLNKVEIVESSSITSIFSGREEGFGTFGKDWRVYYSLIAFHGIISGYRARFTNLSEDDVMLFDSVLLKSIPKMASTRSKVGQAPRLLLRVEYNNEETFLGDLRNGIKISKEDGLRDIGELEVDVSNLKSLLTRNKEKIGKVYLFEDEGLKVEGGSLRSQLKPVFDENLIELSY